MGGRSGKERVLVVADEYYSNLAVVRGLRAAGYEPWVATHLEDTYAERSRATAGTVRVPTPAEGRTAYVVAIADAAAAIGAAAVLPGSEVALAALAGQQDRFTAVVGACAEDVHRRATDKTELYRLARVSGIATPATLQLRRGDLAAHRVDLCFPVVLKAASSAVSSNGRTIQLAGTRLVESPEELEVGLDDEQISIVQQHIDGELIAVAGVAFDGDVICTVHQRARRIEPPVCGTSAFAETIEVDPELDHAIRALVERIGWSGVFQAQLICAGDTAWLIDFNPRPYGSMGLATAAGLNLAALWVDALLGRTPAVSPYRVGTRLRIEARDARAIVRLLARGGVRDGLAALLPRRHTAHAVFMLRDPGPALVLGARVIRKLRDAVGSVPYRERTRASARLAGASPSK